MGWNDVGTAPSASGMFINLKDYIGKKLQMKIVSDEPLSFLNFFNEEMNKGVRVKPGETIHGRVVKAGDKMGGYEFQLKHVFVVLVDVGNGPEYKFFEVSDFVAKQVHSLWEAWGKDFGKVDFIFAKLKAGKVKWEPVQAVPPKGLKAEGPVPNLNTMFKFSSQEDVDDIVPEPGGEEAPF